VLDRIDEFLEGDVRGHGFEGDLELSSGFSKDENDKQLKKKENLQMRQKLMRELYVVESLIHIIYLPFSHGDFNLQQIRTSDLIAIVC